jgi:hypothetical protein
MSPCQSCPGLHVSQRQPVSATDTPCTHLSDQLSCRFCHCFVLYSLYMLKGITGSVLVHVERYSRLCTCLYSP